MSRSGASPGGPLPAFVGLLLRHRLGASLALLALVAALGLGALQTRVDFASTSFYGQDDAAAEELRSFRARWGGDDATLLVLVGSKDGSSVLSPERLAAISALGADLEGLDSGSLRVRRVREIASATLPVPGTDARAPLASLRLDTLAPAEREAVLAELPFVPALLSRDGSLAAILVELDFSSDDLIRSHAALEALELELGEHDKTLGALGLRRDLAGVPAIRAGFLGLVVHDQLRLVPAMLALVGLVLFAAFGRLHGVLIPAAAAGLPLLMLVGAMGWLGQPIGLLNQAYFTLLPVIAVADAIHFVARFHAERRGGRGRDEAIVEASARAGLACLLTTLTTAAGFASLGLARMPILVDFGLYAALGVALAFLVVITAVPLLLSLVGDAASLEARELPGGRLVQGCVRLACSRPKLVLGVATLVTALAIFGAAQVRIDNTLTSLLDPDHPSSRASARVDAELGGTLGLEFELRSSAGPLDAPALFDELAAFETWLRERDEVRSVSGPGSLYAGAAAFSETPGVEARLAALSQRAPFAPVDEHLRRDEHGAITGLRVHAGLPDTSGRAFVDFAALAEAELRERLRSHDDELELVVTGTPLLAYRGVNRITADLRRSFALVFAVVLLTFALVLRSPWALVVGLLPNLLPLLVGYASVALTGGVLDPLAAVILTLGLGVAVDDSLHILARVREATAEPSKPIEVALREALDHSGRAVVLTSVALAGGLALNLGASFPPLNTLGLVGTVIVVTALLADLLVLPALIVLTHGRSLRSTTPR